MAVTSSSGPVQRSPGRPLLGPSRRGPRRAWLGAAAGLALAALASADEASAQVRDLSQRPAAAGSIPKDFARIGRSQEAPNGDFSPQAEFDGVMGRFKGLWNPSYRELPPVPLDGGPLVIGVRVNLVKFEGLDEVAGTVNLVLDLVLSWADERLSFDSDHLFHRPWSHMEDKLPVPYHMMWTPDIVVLNQVSDMDHMFPESQSPIAVGDATFKARTGVNIIWTRRIALKGGCSVDMSKFPFDRQRCSIVIGSWASPRRQMVLVPQDSHDDLATASLQNTSHFRVCNITVQKRDVYMRNAAAGFEELRYELVLERYPHYWVLNFMLPMVAVTMLTIATMWMTNPGIRANSATRMLLCVIQIMNITAAWRPANDTDIWLDRFQTHCLALAMCAVLQSLIMDYLMKTGLFEMPWAPRAHTVETTLRTSICLVAICSFISDLCELTRRENVSELFHSFNGYSQKLIAGFVYMIFALLGASSVGSTLWLLLPSRLWHRFCCKGCSAIASGKRLSIDRPLSVESLSEQAATV